MDKSKTDPREIIDIEGLLIRAYQEKALDRFGGGDRRSQSALGMLIAMTAPTVPGGFNVGERVDTSSFAANRAAREADLMRRIKLTGDSLLALHDAVLGLPLFYVEATGDLDFQVWDAATALSLGHRIEDRRGEASIVAVAPRGGVGAGRDDLVPVGEPRRVERVVPAPLLVINARHAERPYVADVTVTGRQAVYKGADTAPAGYVPVYETPLATVRQGRAEYALWHALLAELARAMADSADYAVTGPAAPAEPWATAKPRILVSLEKKSRAPAPKKAKKRTGASRQNVATATA